MTSGILRGLALLLVMAACIGAYWIFFSGYGETSQQGYAYAVALFSACNQKDTEKLEKIAAMVSRDLKAGEIGIRESKWLNGIIEQGKRGNWPTANRRVRQLLEDQVRETDN